MPCLCWRVELLRKRSIPGRILNAADQSKPPALRPKVSKHLAAACSTFLGLSHRLSWTKSKFNFSLPALWGPYASFLDAFLVFNRRDINIVMIVMFLGPGIEGLFLVFAMNNVTSISIHYLLLSGGTILPIASVVCIFGFSISNNKEVHDTYFKIFAKRNQRFIWVDTQQIGSSWIPTLPPLAKWTRSAGSAPTTCYNWSTSPSVLFSSQTSQWSLLPLLQHTGLLHSGERSSIVETLKPCEKFLPGIQRRLWSLLGQQGTVSLFPPPLDLDSWLVFQFFVWSFNTFYPR